jgi:hypothetical protein
MTPCNVIHFNQIGICQGAGFLSEFARLERFGAQPHRLDRFGGSDRVGADFQ